MKTLNVIDFKVWNQFERCLNILSFCFIIATYFFGYFSYIVAVSFIGEGIQKNAGVESWSWENYEVSANFLLCCELGTKGKQFTLRYKSNAPCCELGTNCKLSLFIKFTDMKVLTDIKKRIIIKTRGSQEPVSFTWL